MTEAQKMMERLGDDLPTILEGWAKVYRDNPKYRFPSDPDAEFFPIDLENAARELRRWHEVAKTEAIGRQRMSQLAAERLRAASTPLSGTEMREALEQIAACALCGYSLNGKENWETLANLISTFNSELQKRVQLAKRALALSPAGQTGTALEQNGFSYKKLDAAAVQAQGGSANDGAPWPRGESMQTDASRPIDSPNFAVPTAPAGGREDRHHDETGDEYEARIGKLVVGTPIRSFDRCETPWQPIETAPKDKTQIIVCGTYTEDVAIVRWDDRAKDWLCLADGVAVIQSQGDTWTDYAYFSVPSHWQPCPTPHSRPEREGK